MQDNESTATEAVVKGWRNGLLLILPYGGDWESVLAQVHTKLDEAKARSFWRGSQTTIDCGMRVITHTEMDALLDLLKRAFGLVPIAVVASESVTREAGEKMALVAYAQMPIIKKFASGPGTASVEKEAVPDPTPVSTPAAAPATPAAQAAPAVPGNNALYMTNTVRSGQRIVHEGHVVIGGDVNAGAEVIAGGDVVVFGTLRGLAHAGAFGDEGARIVAGSLRPPQLRIASKIARSPEEGKGKAAQVVRAPEVARIENGEIQVFPL